MQTAVPDVPKKDDKRMSYMDADTVTVKYKLRQQKSKCFSARWTVLGRKRVHLAGCS